MSQKIQHQRRKRIREELYKESPYCHYCGVETVNKPKPNDKHLRATLDHKIPISHEFGHNGRSNLVIACRKCNVKKGTKSYSEFIKEMEKGE